MNIDCYLFEACGSAEALRENISLVLAIEKVQARVNYHKVDDEDALALGGHKFTLFCVNQSAGRSMGK